MRKNFLQRNQTNSIFCIALQKLHVMRKQNIRVTNHLYVNRNLNLLKQQQTFFIL